MAAVNHVGLCVADLARAEAFYVEALGFTRRRALQVPDEVTSGLLRVERPVGLHAVYLERDGWVLELLHFDRPAEHPTRERPFTEPGLTHISFTVDDLDAARTRVVAHGGEVLDDTAIAGVVVMVRDPDGQLLELLAPDAMG